MSSEYAFCRISLASLRSFNLQREHPARPKSRLGLLQEFCCFPLDFACSRPDCSQEPLPTVRRRSVRRSSPPGLWPHYISLCTACLRFYRRHTARWSGQVAIDDVDGSSAHDVLVQNIAAIGHCEQHDGQRTQIMLPAWHSWQSGPKAKELVRLRQPLYQRSP